MSGTFDPAPMLEAALGEGFDPARELLHVRVAGRSDAAGGLEAATRAAYDGLLAQLDARGLRPVRIWNLVPDINRGADANGDGSLEHYKRFNQGRRDAWRAHDPALGSVCAGTAVGRQDGIDALDVYCLGSAAPLVHRENARQTPFLEYSSRYGPAPCSRRATERRLPARTDLFVAGTASIVGEDTLHADGEPAVRLGRQTEETLVNLAGLLEGSEGWRVASVRVYLREVARAPEVRDTIALRLGVPARDVTFLGADICRRPLEIELECIATAAGAEPLRPRSRG